MLISSSQFEEFAVDGGMEHDADDEEKEEEETEFETGFCAGAGRGAEPFMLRANVGMGSGLGNEKAVGQCRLSGLIRFVVIWADQ